MAEIIGNTTATPVPRSDWAQTDQNKADYIKNKPNVVVVDDRGSISQGDSASAITKESVALGNGSVAGARGFGVKSFDHTNRQLTIALEHPDSKETAVPDYAVGDKFSILNVSHYAFCGTIGAISVNNANKTATITYTPTTEHGTNSSREDPWWIHDIRTIVYPIRAIFWVPEKPLVGYDLEYQGEVAFPNAIALNGGLASAKGAIVNGEGSAAGGNWAAIFGELIRAAYGNLSSGRENDSTGLHSGLIGRWLKNYGDYNFLANKAVEVLRGNCNAGFGSTNTLHQGDCNGFVGYLLKIFGDLNGVCGYGHELGDAEKGYKAHYSAVSGKNHKIGKERSVSYANVSGVGHEVNHEGVDVSGWDHKSSRDYQVLRGYGSQQDPGAAFILALGKNIFTIGESGTRENVGTDGVTVDFLKKYVADAIASIKEPDTPVEPDEPTVPWLIKNRHLTVEDPLYVSDTILAPETGVEYTIYKDGVEIGTVECGQDKGEAYLWYTVWDANICEDVGVRYESGAWYALGMSDYYSVCPKGSYVAPTPTHTVTLGEDGVARVTGDGIYEVDYKLYDAEYGDVRQTVTAAEDDYDFSDYITFAMGYRYYVTAKVYLNGGQTFVEITSNTVQFD